MDRHYRALLVQIAVLVALGIAALVEGVAAATEPSLVLLFDKKCRYCRACLVRPRHLPQPTLTLLLRQGNQYIVRERWRARYGKSEGAKQCLGDARTPEGIYYTKYVNENRGDQAGYGYVTVGIDYPNQEDRQNLLVDSCGEPCFGPGALVAIHGGAARATRGCIRLTDEEHSSSGYHFKSIDQLANIVRSVPEERMPLISVPYAAPGCQPEKNQALSAGCAAALTEILDAPERPRRQRVAELLAEARNFEPGERIEPGGVGPAMAGTPASDQETPLDAVAQWATSEAPVCGAQRDEPCRTEHLTDRKPETVWCESADGVGRGEWIVLELPRPQRIARVQIWNGNWQGGAFSVDWTRNGRATALDLEINGTVERCTLAAEDPSRASCVLGVAQRSSRVLLRITDAVRGALQDHTCISEIMLFPTAQGHGPSAQRGR